MKKDIVKKSEVEVYKPDEKNFHRVVFAKAGCGIPFGPIELKELAVDGEQVAIIPSLIDACRKSRD